MLYFYFYFAPSIWNKNNSLMGLIKFSGSDHNYHSNIVLQQLQMKCCDVSDQNHVYKQENVMKYQADM